jgi:hypothetical protein
MRRAFGGGIAGLGVGGGARVADQAFAEAEKFATEPGEILGHFEHGAVLRSDVVLQMRELFLEASNFFVHGR